MRNLFFVSVISALRDFGLFLTFLEVISMDFSGFSGKILVFPVNQLWKISYLLYEMGLSLFAFVKHLYTCGITY